MRCVNFADSEFVVVISEWKEWNGEVFPRMFRVGISEGKFQEANSEDSRCWLLSSKRWDGSWPPLLAAEGIFCVQRMKDTSSSIQMGLDVGSEKFFQISSCASIETGKCYKRRLGTTKRERTTQFNLHHHRIDKTRNGWMEPKLEIMKTRVLSYAKCSISTFCWI